MDSLHNHLKTLVPTESVKAQLRAEWRLYRSMKPDDSIRYHLWYIPTTWNTSFWNVLGIYSIIFLLVFSLYCWNTIP